LPNSINILIDYIFVRSEKEFAQTEFTNSLSSNIDDDETCKIRFDNPDIFRVLPKSYNAYNICQSVKKIT
jgi:hypothetical protein